MLPAAPLAEVEAEDAQEAFSSDRQLLADLGDILQNLVSCAVFGVLGCFHPCFSTVSRFAAPYVDSETLDEDIWANESHRHQP